MFSIEYRYFYQAGVDKSVRKAANSLNINSSAVVRQIHKLEDNLNMKLFDRSSKGLSLTNEGKADPTLFVEDGLHINAKGYEVWTKLVRSAIENL